MREEMELRDIFQIIQKRLGIIAVITIVAVAISAIVSIFLLDEIYETSTTLMVANTRNNQSDSIEYNTLLVNQKLVKTYSVIAKSDRVLDRVIEKLGIDMKPSELKDKITVASEGETEIIRITVEDTDPGFAMDLANLLAQVFMEQVVNIMKLDNVQVIDVAKIPEKPVKPRPLLNTAIAGVLGVMLGIGVVFLVEYLDNTIKTPEDIERYIGLPVIGIIPMHE
jgi:capsular polysaccharide biosynthesis protein